MTFNQHRAVKPSEACFLTCVLLTVKLWEVAPATLSVFMQLVFTQFQWIPAVTRIHGGEKKNCQNIIRNVSKHSCCKDSASPKSICSRSMFLFLAVLLPIVLPELRMTGGWWCNMLVKLRAALSVQINTPKEDYGTKVVEDVVWVWGGLYFLQTRRHYPFIHHPSSSLPLKSPKSTWWASERAPSFCARYGGTSSDFSQLFQWFMYVGHKHSLSGCFSRMKHRFPCFRLLPHFRFCLL